LLKEKTALAANLVSATMMEHGKLIERIEKGYIQQAIIANLKLSCYTSNSIIDSEINLYINPEIEVLLHLLFTHFESKDRSYPIVPTIEMIKRKIFQKNNNYLKKYFEIFKLNCYIRLNIHQSVSVKDVAKYMLMSQSTLRRFCIQRLGKTASELIRDVRTSEAKNLLETTDDPVSVIAEKLKFFSTQTFSASFRQQMGFSPKEYRNCYQKIMK
jgi:AraC-like DNA-binding protein